jgi:arylsulfatase A-like enzyme
VTVKRIILALTAIAILASGCSRGEAPPNVILITLDTMRADHLACYGYSRPTSPNIDALAAGATLYTHARSAAPWTVPSHASLFTGKYPFEHGAHSFAVPEPTDNNVNPLSVRFVTLAEALQEEGYRTGAFVANEAFLNTYWQLDQGFETYHVELVMGHILTRKALSWLVGAKDRPFFLFLNYMDTHGPYNTTWPASFLAEPAVVDRGDLLEALYNHVMPDTAPVPPELAQKVIDQYDTAVANVDKQIGVLVERLKAMDIYDNTVIVVTSDHGEFFGEHHLVKHSKDIYEPVMRVPLIVKQPFQEMADRSDVPVTSSDVPGLIFEQFPETMSARLSGMFTDLPGNHPLIAENYYTRTRDLFHPLWGHRFDRVRTSIYEGSYKLIRSSDGQHELYDLDQDPAESNNLFNSPDHRDTAQRLEAKLIYFQDSRRRADELTEQKPLSEEQLEKLRALGYIK